MDLDKIKAYKEEQQRQRERAQELAKFDELGGKLEKFTNTKAPVLSVDGTDLASKIEELKAYLAQVFQVMAQGIQDTTVVEALNEQFISMVDQILRVQDGKDKKLQESLDKFTESVKKLDTRPQVDVRPIASAIRDNNKPKVIDLNDYKAQDLTGDDFFQYVGFVAPSGQWYILENDMSGGKLRYKFGKKDYGKNWDKYATQSYKLLNEAIREVQA